jgi:hypothetical protein
MLPSQPARPGARRTRRSRYECEPRSTLRESIGPEAQGGRGGMTIRADLEAYHDQELSWWRRRRVEAGLRRSSELRQELDLLKQMSTAAGAAGSADQAATMPDIWGEISGQLAGIDAQKRARVAAVRESVKQPGGLRGFFEWKPMGWAMAAGAAALAIGLWNASGRFPDEQTGRVVRYLDTEGRPVMVVDEEDVTIIWLMGGASSSDEA